jgi:hypothetical protein
MDGSTSIHGISERTPEIPEPSFVTQDQIAALIQFLDVPFEDLDRVSGGLRNPDGGVPDGGRCEHRSLSTVR